MRAVVITGASSGFGKQMVSDYLKQGWAVYACLRNASERKDLFTKDLELFPDRLNLCSLDITESSQISELGQYLKNAVPDGVDALINNAGYGLYGTLEDLSIKQIRYQMEVNFFGPVQLIKELLPLIRLKQGNIINVSSLMGMYSCPLASIYSASKFALEGLTEGLAYELKPFKVSVCTVRPGAHNTGFSSSVNWGEGSFNNSSSYQTINDSFKKMMASVSKQKMTPGPKGVSKLIVRLSNKSSMERFYLAGMDSHLIGYFKKLFPEFIYQRVMFLVNKFVFK